MNKATALAWLVAAALLVAAASSERLPTFDEFLQQTPGGAAAKAKTASAAGYPSVEVEEVQFVSTTVHDCRCPDGYWNSAPTGLCLTPYSQVDLACASKENDGYGYDYKTVAAIPVATAVGRCDISENYFKTAILLTAGVVQTGTFTATCKLDEYVEDCEGRGPACGGMVVNVEGAVYQVDNVYLKGMPAATVPTAECNTVYGGDLRLARPPGAKKAAAAKVASYHDDEQERPYYERREEYYREREQYYSGYDRTYGYDGPVFYKAARAFVYHGTTTVVSAHKSAQAYETVGTFQFTYIATTDVANTTLVPHPPAHAFIAKGNTFTFGFFKGDKHY